MSRLNAAWNDTERDEAGRFARAVALVTAEFTEVLRRLQTVWLPARQLVEMALRDRHQVSAAGLRRGRLAVEMVGPFDVAFRAVDCPRLHTELTTLDWC